MVDSAAYRWNRRACSLSSLWEEGGESPDEKNLQGDVSR